jgi:ATP-dependent Zn protease
MSPEYFIIPMIMNQFTSIATNLNTGIYLLDTILILSLVLIVFTIDFSQVKQHTTNKLYTYLKNTNNNTIIISSDDKYRSIKFKSIMFYITTKIDPTIYRIKEYNEYKWNDSEDKDVEKSSEYIVDQIRTFILDKDIYGIIKEERVEHLSYNNNTEYKKMYVLTIFTKYKTLIDLQNWINNRVSEYKLYLRSKTNEGQLFITVLQKKVSKNDSEQLNITGNLWESTCTFENSYFNMKDNIMKKIDFFLNNKKWYSDHGIPYNLGILLYGEPGCGKTRFIKQLLNYTKRHAIDIKINDALDFSELKKIIYNENIGDEYIIPQEKRILIFEDIDSMGDVIKDRDIKKKNEKNDDKNTDSLLQLNKNIFDLTLNQTQEKLNNNLSFLLNILDGINECSGRIIIMTTNKIDTLDKALIRPGRIDIMVELKKSTRYDILKMIQAFWKIDIKIDKIKEELDNVYTSAEIINIFRSTDNFDEIKHFFI